MLKGRNAKDNIDKIYLGIDWGTHSSKWAADIIMETHEDEQLSGIVSSDLLLHDSNIVMNPRDTYYPEIERVKSFKSNIINDPYSPFWADRDDIGMSMGAGVAFSICSLLGAFLSEISKKSFSINNSTKIEVGFSFPNWLNENHSKNAAKNYHQAIVVSCCLFNSYKDDKLPCSEKPYPVNQWKQLIDETKSILSLPEQIITVDNMTKTKYKPADFNYGNDDNNLTWSYLVESCAAGLPYLRNIKLQEPPGLPGLGKLLVVDIGAGSTDIGYMLRTLNLEGIENLFYFPPAATLRVAGNRLTDEILRHQNSIGRHITFTESENYKITRTDDWIDEPFAIRWKREICEHITEYIKNSPDRRWLNVEVPIQLITTGGSSVIRGLTDELKKALREGLLQRGLAKSVFEKINTVSDNLFERIFPVKGNYARMAVAIGSADRNKPKLEYLDRMDPLIRIRQEITKY